jgi:Zn-dependent M28 family amino/carboxypeptidase
MEREMSKTILLMSVAVAAVLSSPTTTLADHHEAFSSKALRDAIRLPGIRAHQQALQNIANDHDGTRASGTPGFMASLHYVKKRAEKFGLITKVQHFDFAFFRELSPSELSQVAPNAVTYVNGTDFLTMTYSGAGDVTAVVQPVGGIVIPPTQTASSASGCTAADFSGFVPGNIALIQRGTCTFYEKAVNADAAGASGVIIFNEGNPGEPDRIPLFGGTLGTPVDLPVLSVSFAFGETLYNASKGGSSVTLRMKTDTESEIRPTANLIAETPYGRNDSIVVVGAHLDSVLEGPGIQDNGSGSAGILEIAETMSKLGIKPRNKVRFAWWGAEESGLLGSEYYVSQLSKEQIKNITVNLNFDMIGSPNFARFVYDGDGSDTGTAGPRGSGRIEEVFARYFKNRNLPFEATEFDGRSDYGPFIDVGIPAGGLFTGAEGIKTPDQAAKYGGTAGVAFDPCYHQACDTLSNISTLALKQMTDAAGHAVLQFAMRAIPPSQFVGDESDKTADMSVKRVSRKSLLYKGGQLQR